MRRERNRRRVSIRANNDLERTGLREHQGMRGCMPDRSIVLSRRKVAAAIDRDVEPQHQHYAGDNAREPRDTDLVKTEIGRFGKEQRRDVHR